MLSLPIDNELYQSAIRAAAANGQSVDEFVAAAVRAAINQPAARLSQRNGFPIFEVTGGSPTIDPERVQQFIAEEGF